MLGDERVKKLVIASPRGFCAGVKRAIEIVEKAIQLWGAPIYVKHEIVHNQFVVDSLREKGAIFVDELDEIPPGSRVIFSAHGVPPSAFQDADQRGLKVTDATCPLVTKVHKEAARFSKKGYEILLVGHENHVETIGTRGVAPLQTAVVESVEDAHNVLVKDPSHVAVLTQTTLSVDDTKDILQELKSRFPDIQAPSKSDICYATTNRQAAIKEICKEVDLVLVVGSRTSSNSNRLREVAERAGVCSYLISSESEIMPQWLQNVRSVGMTAGASTPETIIMKCIAKLRSLGVTEVEERPLVEESVQFNLPPMH